MTTKKPFDPKSTNIMNWYVLCVTPDKEIKIANILKSMGIEVFCPTSNEVRHWSERKETVSVPLFKSYIFVKISKRNRVLVFNVPGVTRYLFCEGRPAQVRDSEINTMKSWIEDDTVYEIVITKYSASNNITIRNSLFKDRQAAMKRLEKKNLIMILKCLDVVLHAKAEELVRYRKFFTHQSLN